MKEQLEIHLNKKKILSNLPGALIFVILGIWIIGLAINAKNQILIQAIFFIVGLTSILFFGLISIVLLTKIVTSKAGMIINDEGLVDNTSGVSSGFIAWHDIKKINFSLSGSHTFLVIILKNPDKYIEREANFFKKITMRMNHKISGSPIHILVSFLDMDLNTLNEIIINKRFQKKPTAGLG